MADKGLRGAVGDGSTQKLGLDGKPIAEKPGKPKPKPDDHYAKTRQVDPAVMARVLAAQTGVPQPVVENGKVLYYVDTDGAAIPQAIAEDRRRSAGLDTPAAGEKAPAAAAPNGAAAADPAASGSPVQSDAGIQQGIADYNAAQYGFAHGGNATVNGAGYGTTDPLGITGGGKPATLAGADKSNEKDVNDRPIGGVLSGDGSTNVTDTFVGQQAMAAQTGQATLAALDMGSAYSADTQLLFSQGAGGLTAHGTQFVRTPNGFTVQAKQDNRQDLQAGPRGLAQNQPMNSQQQLDTAQHMTIGDGLDWFARLSVDDKDAYNQLVGQLNHAGYFADQTGGNNYVPDSQLPLNTYSRNAGRAMVEAMQDLAVAQSHGETSDMASWLQKRSQGYEDYVKGGAGYNPVNRSYQDPATLALSAKNAAQAAIGRNLTPAEEAKFEAAFHGKEAAAYDEMDAYGRAKAVANFTAKNGLPAGTPSGYTMPDTAGESDAFLNNNPQFAAEKQQYGGLELTKGLLTFLKGGGF